jgi:prepilin-type N-terminal cleavage/methylation domain-containing protein
MQCHFAQDVRDSTREAGFSLPELLIAMTVMLLISGAATTALLKMTSTQATLWNRTQMHSGIRGATEVLQQEVGQAGRIALPTSTVTLTAAVAAGSHPVTVTSVSGMFNGEKLTIDAGCFDTASPCTSVQEVITLTANPDTSTNTITAVFVNAHASGAPLRAQGGFAYGIVPPTTVLTNGSSGSVLKMFGDINADGNMLYIEYTCDTASGNLYRNSMAFNTASKLAATASQILLSNITSNPNGTACFTYQTSTAVVKVNGVDTTMTFVTDVAITLTVKTQLIDPITKDYQKETKALLNVSPRNVFNTWEVASLGYSNRVQLIPASVTNLLAGTGS